MSFDIVRTTVSAAVVSGGTITFAYPAGKDAGNYRGSNSHVLFSRGLMASFANPSQFTIAFGANPVVTYNGSTTIPANTEVSLQLNYVGADQKPPAIANTTNRLKAVAPYLVDYGTVDTAVANGVFLSAALTAAGSVTPVAPTGSLLSGGVAVFDVPRNVVAAWTGTSVITVTGTDEYGAVLKESSASGTSLTGKKAFKTVTGISVSADVTGLTVGTGVVLGLPVFLPYAAGSVVKEIQDGANATAGTVVAGVTTAATATSGDVRGTWAPNGAPNGTINFAVVVHLDDPNYRGVAQFAG
jgi:hypothetical protein